MAGRYPSKAVANWDLRQVFSKGKSFTQLQIHKLVYIAHGWHLAVDPAGDGLIAENVHAWKYGPVIPSLRDEFREFGSSPISRLANEGGEGPTLYEPDLTEYEPEQWEFNLLKFVFEKYGHLQGPQLIDITHRPGSPWHEVTQGGTTISYGLVIPNENIRSHYVKLLEDLRNSSG